MDDSFTGAGRAERDHRDAQRRRGAGAGSGGQDRSRGEGQRRGIQAAEAANRRAIANQRAAADGQGVQGLVTGQRIRRRRSRLVGLRGRRAEHVASGSITRESDDTVCGVIGGELAPTDRHASQDARRRRRKGRSGGKLKIIGRRAERTCDVQGTSGAPRERREGQERVTGPGHVDRIATLIRREGSRGLSGTIRDEMEGGALELEPLSGETAGRARRAVVELQERAAADRRDGGGVEGDGRGVVQDDRASVDLEAAAVVNGAGDGRADGQRAGAIFVDPPERAGQARRGGVQGDVAFGVELESVGAGRRDQTGNREGAAGAGADGRVERHRNRTRIGIIPGDAFQLPTEIDARLQKIGRTLYHERVADGHATGQLKRGPDDTEARRDGDSAGTSGRREGRVIDQERALVDADGAAPA